MGPGQVAGQAQPSASAVEGQSGGGVQQAVAQSLGLGAGQLAGQREALGPGSSSLGALARLLVLRLVLHGVGVVADG